MKSLLIVASFVALASARSEVLENYCEYSQCTNLALGLRCKVQLHANLVDIIQDAPTFAECDRQGNCGVHGKPPQCLSCTDACLRAPGRETIQEPMLTSGQVSGSEPVDTTPVQPAVEPIVPPGQVLPPEPTQRKVCQYSDCDRVENIVGALCFIQSTSGATDVPNIGSCELGAQGCRYVPPGCDSCVAACRRNRGQDLVVEPVDFSRPRPVQIPRNDINPFQTGPQPVPLPAPVPGQTQPVQPVCIYEGCSQLSLVGGECHISTDAELNGVPNRGSCSSATQTCSHIPPGCKDCLNVCARNPGQDEVIEDAVVQRPVAGLVYLVNPLRKTILRPLVVGR